jgi:hypothetical protein
MAQNNYNLQICKQYSTSLVEHADSRNEKCWLVPRSFARITTMR